MEIKEEKIVPDIKIKSTEWFSRRTRFSKNQLKIVWRKSFRIQQSFHLVSTLNKIDKLLGMIDSANQARHCLLLSFYFQ